MAVPEFVGDAQRISMIIKVIRWFYANNDTAIADRAVSRKSDQYKTLLPQFN